MSRHQPVSGLAIFASLAALLVIGSLIMALVTWTAHNADLPGRPTGAQWLAIGGGVAGIALLVILIRRANRAERGRRP